MSESGSNRNFFVINNRNRGEQSQEKLRIIAEKGAQFFTESSRRRHKKGVASMESSGKKPMYVFSSGYLNRRK